MNNNEEREFIEIENLNGEIEQVEIIDTIKSKRDDKTYVILTPDKEINDEVNISVGYIYEDGDRINLELVEDNEELSYVYSLINNELMEG